MNGHKTLFAPFAKRQYPPFLRVDVFYAQVNQLAHAQARGIQQFHDG